MPQEDRGGNAAELVGRERKYDQKEVQNTESDGGVSEHWTCHFGRIPMTSFHEV